MSRIQELVDEEIEAPRERRKLMKHISACERCGLEAEAIRQLKIAISRVCCAPNDKMCNDLKRFAIGLGR